MRHCVFWHFPFSLPSDPTFLFTHTYTTPHGCFQQIKVATDSRSPVNIRRERLQEPEKKRHNATYHRPVCVCTCVHVCVSVPLKHRYTQADMQPHRRIEIQYLVPASLQLPSVSMPAHIQIWLCAYIHWSEHTNTHQAACSHIFLSFTHKNVTLLIFSTMQDGGFCFKSLDQLSLLICWFALFLHLFWGGLFLCFCPRESVCQTLMSLSTSVPSLCGMKWALSYNPAV